MNILLKERRDPEWTPGRRTGNELREWRESKNLTQQQLATAANVCTTTISTAERRKDAFIPRKLQRELDQGGVMDCRIQFRCDLGWK